MEDTTIRQLKYNRTRLAIFRLIAESQLQIGDRLPSLRELVKILPCSSITIRRALSDLEQSGLIVSKQGSGTYLAQEIKNDHFQNFVLFISVYQEGDPLQGWGTDPLRIYLAQRGVSLINIAVTGFGLDVTNAASGNCLGIIVGGWITDEFLSQLQALQLPIVIQGDNKLKNSIPMVSWDMALGAYRMTSIMHEDSLKDIALFRGEKGYYNGDLAEEGYRKARQEAGLPELIMSVANRFDYNRQIDRFMKFHPDVEGILMEHTTFLDFMAWAWTHDYHRHPTIAFLSKEPTPKQYLQSRNFLWMKFEDPSVHAGKMLLEHVIQGTPMTSVSLPPTIPLIDDDNQFFIG